eukprot:83211_1
MLSKSLWQLKILVFGSEYRKAANQSNLNHIVKTLQQSIMLKTQQNENEKYCRCVPIRIIIHLNSILDFLLCVICFHYTYSLARKDTWNNNNQKKFGQMLLCLITTIIALVCGQIGWYMNKNISGLKAYAKLSMVSTIECIIYLIWWCIAFQLDFRTKVLFRFAIGVLLTALRIYVHIKMPQFIKSV